MTTDEAVIFARQFALYAAHEAAQRAVYPETRVGADGSHRNMAAMLLLTAAQHFLPHENIAIVSTLRAIIRTDPSDYEKIAQHWEYIEGEAADTARYYRNRADAEPGDGYDEARALRPAGL